MYQVQDFLWPFACLIPETLVQMLLLEPMQATNYFGKVLNMNKPVLKGFKTFIALAQSFWTLCFVIS